MKLFCKHIYVREAKEFLGIGMMDTGSVITGSYKEVSVKAYLVIYRCVKCGKVKKDVTIEDD